MSSSSNSTQTQLVISSTQESALLEIMVLFLLTTGTLAVLARTFMKYFSARKLGLDDILIFTSLICYAGQSAAVFVASTHNLGTLEEDPSTAELDLQLKAEYAATILQLASIASAKASYICFVRALSPGKLEKRISLGLFAAVGIWWLTATFSALFQCGLPQPWNYVDHKCFDRQAWWTYVTIVNILTEVALVALPFRIVWQLQVNQTHRKVPALLVFSSRLLIIVTAAVQLYLYINALSSGNVQFYIWQPILCAQFVQCINIVCTSFLYIKLLMDSLESGFLRVDDVRRREHGTSGNNNKHSGYGGSNSNSKKLESSSAASESNANRHRVDMSLTKSRPTSRPISTTLHTPFRSPPQSPRWPLGGDEGVDLPHWEHKQGQVIVETKSFSVEESQGSSP